MPTLFLTINQRMRKSKILNVIFNIIIVLSIMVIGFFIGFMIRGNNRGYSSADKEFVKTILGSQHPSGQKYTTIFTLIDNNYYEEINVDSIAESMIPTLLSKLDPHSSYAPPKDAVLSRANLQGNFDGIGVTFNMITDTIVIQSVIPGGPSDKKGLVGGDRIMTIDNELVAGQKIPSDSILLRLRGVKGTTVMLGIKRDEVDSVMNVPVVRDKIIINSIDAAYMATPTTGYIKLLRFASSSHTEMKEAINKLYNQGMKHLILDLTENRGGYLNQAILISNEFLPKGNAIVSTQHRGEKMDETVADGRGSYIGQDVIVLVNENSASSSEIVAGALQDNDVGTIVGRRTFGKGLVQQSVPLNDGSLLNLTVATYHTPTGRSIQRPYNGNKGDYDFDYYNRIIGGELMNKDSVKLDSTLRYTTPKGKVVYGGGGIMPDEYVAIDTAKYTIAERKLLISIVMIRYTNDYISKHRKELNEIKTFEELESYFKKDGDRLYDGYIKYVNKHGAKITAKEAKASRHSVENVLKARVGQLTQVGDNAFYKYIQTEDDITMRALELIEEKERE